jgi:hypothetical protein
VDKTEKSTPNAASGFAGNIRVFLRKWNHKTASLLPGVFCGTVNEQAPATVRAGNPKILRTNKDLHQTAGQNARKFMTFSFRYSFLKLT